MGKVLLLVLLVGARANGAYIEGYLAEHVKYNKYVCNSVVAPLQPELFPACIAKIEDYLKDVKECDTSPQRQRELDRIEEKELAGLFTEYGQAEIPKSIEHSFNKLTKAALTLFPDSKNLNWNLLGYKNKIKNAHSFQNGTVLLTAALWADSNPLSTDEITAIMAHEIAHAIKKHGIQLACLSVAWMTEPRSELNFTMQTMRQGLHENFNLKEAWQKLSNSIEYEADEYAITILRAAKLNPLLMSQAIEKIVPKQEGIPSGSHPETQTRIQVARSLAK